MFVNSAGVLAFAPDRGQRLFLGLPYGTKELRI